MDTESTGQSGPGGTRRGRNSDEKFCASCGEVIKINADTCPYCAAGQGGGISKAALLVFTFFLGGFGAHKFYTRRNLQGVLYLIFCWTGIPYLIALVEFIVYAFTSSERLREKYKSSGSATAIACIAAAFGMIYIFGIISAIAIPQFVKQKNRAYESLVAAELRELKVAEDAFFMSNGRYSSDLDELQFSPQSLNIQIDILSADETCYEARGVHGRQIDKYLYMDCKGLKIPDS